VRCGVKNEGVMRIRSGGEILRERRPRQETALRTGDGKRQRWGDLVWIQEQFIEGFRLRRVARKPQSSG